MYYAHLLLTIPNVPVREVRIIILLKSQLGKPRHIEGLPRVTNKPVPGLRLDSIICDWEYKIPSEYSCSEGGQEKNQCSCLLPE